MKLSGNFFPICCLCLVVIVAGGTSWRSGKDAIRLDSSFTAVAQNADKLVYADFETVKGNRVVSNGGGIIGAGERPQVQEASRQFIGWGNRLLGSAEAVASTQPPANGTYKPQWMLIGVTSITSP